MSSDNQESFGQKMQRGFANCCASTGLCCFKLKEQTQISALEYKITNRKKKFGVDYLTLVERKASQDALKMCLKEALRDIAELQTQVNDHYDNIDSKENNVQQKKDDRVEASEPSKKPEGAQEEGEDQAEAHETKAPKKKSGKKKKKPKEKSDE